MIRSLERLSQAWNGLPLGSPLWFFESVSSTNDVLKQRAEQGAPEGSVVMAATQTRGRGRQGRSWLSLSGQGLYLSVLLRPGWPAADAGLAATMASLATARCLQRFGVGGGDSQVAQRCPGPKPQDRRHTRGTAHRREPHRLHRRRGRGQCEPRRFRPRRRLGRPRHLLPASGKRSLGRGCGRRPDPRTL